jgi:hypothetical protein
MSGILFWAASKGYDFKYFSLIRNYLLVVPMKMAAILKILFY